MHFPVSQDAATETEIHRQRAEAKAICRTEAMVHRRKAICRTEAMVYRRKAICKTEAAVHRQKATHRRITAQKKNRNQSDTSQSRRTDGADGVLDDAGDIVRDAGDAVGDVVDDLTGETTGRSRMTE